MFNGVKKQRTAGPETALMKPMTGAAALHTVLMQVALARDAFEVLGIDCDHCTRELVEQKYEVLVKVVHPVDVSRALPRGMGLYDVVMPFAWGAYFRMKWARRTLFRLMEDSMLAQVNAVLAGTGVQYAFARDLA